MRSFVLLLAFICLGLLAATIISCGSTSGGKNCTGGPYNVAGNWQITVNPDGVGSVSGWGAIDPSGLAVFFEATGDTVELPTITGACYFSGNMTAYAEPGSVTAGGTTVVTDPAEGNVNSSTAITGKFTGKSPNPSGSFSISSFSPLSPAATAFTGAMTGVSKDLAAAVLLEVTFAQIGSGSSMSFSSTNLSSCAVTGTFTQAGTSNVFDVAMNFTGSGPGCPASGSVTGIGFESNTDYLGLSNGASGPHLYADLVQPSSSAFVIEFHQ